MIKKSIPILICLLVSAHIYSQGIKDSIVRKTIVYHSKNAGEVFFVWAINDWEIPSPSLRPDSTIVKRKLAYTKMLQRNEEYAVTIALPHKTSLNFLFLKSKDRTGNSIEEWDDNGKNVMVR